MKEYNERIGLADKKNAVRIHLKKAANGCDFGDVDIYVRTSDKSGDYFVKYCLCYEKNEIGKTCKSQDGEIVPLTWYNGANGGYNRSNYRIKTASVCKQNGEGFDKVYDVLQQGEISMAVKEGYADNSSKAGDFVGGYHGDELIKYENGTPLVKLTLDGADIPLDGREERKCTGDRLCFWQTTVVDRCNTPGANIMEHSQSYSFDTSGMRNSQSVKFLTSDYEIGGNYALDFNGTYLQMCTFWRLNNGEKYVRICDDLKFYGEDKRQINSADTSGFDLGDFAWVGVETEKQNRFVEYNGKAGVYGFVGFEIADDTVECHSAKIMVRTFGDNKWYCSFKSRSDNGQPKKGEEWKLELLYYIDYNSER